MLIKGKLRGNGAQLASYLLKPGENEWVRVLDVDGQQRFSERDFRNLLTDMSRNERLTRSKQGIYNAIIAPAPVASQRFQDEDWEEAADLMMKELGFEGQRRAMVLHQKRGKIHCHLIMERYNHETGKMIPIGNNYHAHDRVRATLEARHEHRMTPRRNPNRPGMRQTLSGLWQEAKNGTEFIRLAREHGYTIATGYGRVAYAVVDSTGTSFNLIRHLEKVKTKEVRGRLDGQVLQSEKEAIAFVRTRQATTRQRKQAENIQPDTAAAFADTANDTMTPRPKVNEVQSSEPSPFAKRLAEQRRRQQMNQQKPKH